MALDGFSKNNAPPHEPPICCFQLKHRPVLTVIHIEIRGVGGYKTKLPYSIIYYHISFHRAILSPAVCFYKSDMVQKVT